MITINFVVSCRPHSFEAFQAGPSFSGGVTQKLLNSEDVLFVQDVACPISDQPGQRKIGGDVGIVFTVQKLQNPVAVRSNS